MRRLCAAIAMVVACTAPLVLAPGVADATSATVTTEAALRTAFADSTVDTVTLGDDIDLTDCSASGGDLDRTAPVAVTLDGAGFTLRQTCEGERVIETAGDLTIEHLILTGGNLVASGEAQGGGVLGAGAITLLDATVTGNSAVGDAGASGGGVHSGAAVDVTDSRIVDNRASSPTTAAVPTAVARGGGVFASTAVSLVRSSVSGNRAEAHGTVDSFVNGGGVFADTGTFADAHLDGNTGLAGGASGSVLGGGAFLDALTMDRSTADGNTADGPGAMGGALDVDTGELVMTDSQVSGNRAVGSATASGGALVLGGASSTIRGSTLADNRVQGGDAALGGAVYGTGQHDVVILDSTVTGNVAAAASGLGRGGALATQGLITLVYSTVVRNGADGGGNFQSVPFATYANGNLVATGSVIGAPASGGNCSYGRSTPNLVASYESGGPCGSTDVNSIVDDAGDPMLGPLADNGGPTLTLLPLPGSPLIDSIPVELCQVGDAAGITTDQRGVVRPLGSGCDMGSVEQAGPARLAPGFTG